MAEEARKELPQVYHVQNTVRRVGTRLHRAKSATRHRFKLWVNGRRLLRNQKMPLTAKQFEACKEQIEKMVLAGQVALFLPDGMRVTSLPDGRMVFTKANGAMKIGEMPASSPAPSPKAEVKSEEPEGDVVPQSDGEGDAKRQKTDE